LPVYLALCAVCTTLAACPQSSILDPRSSVLDLPLPPPKALSEKKLQALWQDLAGIDARQAYQSLWQLITVPGSAVPFLDRHLKNPPAPNQKLISQLITDLDSDEYVIRGKAMAKLASLGLAAQEHLEQALAKPASPEAAVRLGQLLKKLSWRSLSAPDLRTWRAIEALEYIGTPAAQQVLQRLAGGSPLLWQTRQAQASLHRLQAPRPTVKLAKEFKVAMQLNGHKTRIYSLAWSPDGALLASAGADHTVRLWDMLALGKPHATLSHPNTVWSVAFTPDGKRLVSACSDQTVRLWDVASGKLLRTIAAQEGIVYGVAVSPDGKVLASGGSDKTVRLWDAPGLILDILQGHGATVWDVNFSPDGKTLVSACSDRSVKLWEVVTGQERASFEGHKDFARVAAFTADGKHIVSADSCGLAILWDQGSGHGQHIPTGQEDGVRGLACSPDGKLFATAGSDTTVKLWDAGGKELATLTGHTDKARCVAFKSDGRYLATGSYDHTIKIWKLAAE
jgi:WD40 repeat protein